MKTRWLWCLVLVWGVLLPLGLVHAALTDKIPTIPLSQALGDVTAVTGIPDYINQAYRYMVGIVATVAIVMVTYGGFRYLIGASQGDVARGKQIIKDAIIGLVMVFLAYLVLKTINPATTKFAFFVPAAKIAEAPAAMGKGTLCKVDKDCKVGGSGGACLLYDKDAGECANGSDGSLCECRGGGCLRGSTTWKIASYEDCIKGILPPLMLACAGLRYAQQSTIACDLDDADKKCNGNGKGGMPCKAGLSCVMQDMLGTFRCRAVKETTTSPTGSFCNKDSACPQGSSCIMLTATIGACSDGSEGNMCKCSEYGGCQITDNAAQTNNGGSGSKSCKSGLECRVYSGGSTADVNGVTILKGGWVCAKP